MKLYTRPSGYTNLNNNNKLFHAEKASIFFNLFSFSASFFIKNEYSSHEIIILSYRLCPP